MPIDGAAPTNNALSNFSVIRKLDKAWPWDLTRSVAADKRMKLEVCHSFIQYKVLSIRGVPLGARPAQLCREGGTLHYATLHFTALRYTTLQYNTIFYRCALRSAPCSTS